MPRKTEFLVTPAKPEYRGMLALHITGRAPKDKPYLWIGSITGGPCYGWVDGKDLERLARNILHALGKDDAK